MVQPQPAPPWLSSETVLLERWARVEEAEEALAEDELSNLKEAWFKDAFKFLRNLPVDQHCWCSHYGVVLPLLEPFYHYNSKEGPDPTLQELWTHLSKELAVCMRCVMKHYAAQKHYANEFEEDVVKPMLKNLQQLDEERVATTLQRLGKRIEEKTAGEEIRTEMTCVMFEILMYPALLEDAAVNQYFGPILKHMIDFYDISLQSGQRYPGLFTLLFHEDASIRSIAFNLAKKLENLKDAADLESVQPLLQRCMHSLENDLFGEKPSRKGLYKFLIKKESLPVVEPGKERPRTSRTKEEIWLGLQSLLGLLGPSAFEEGVVERHPGFVGLVLNQVSGESSVFRHALNCLKMLFEVLGYKLWLRSSYSPAMVRNALVTQCFHATKEPAHKALLDLVRPFLQSLEALQDGEFERQRRRFLHFLLTQIPCSSSYSPSIRKIARQIAFTIVARGYTLQPPSPPLECVHVWGPPLIATVKDTSLLQPLRQPALDLAQIIVTADVAVLVSLSASSSTSPSPSPSEFNLFSIDESEEPPQDEIDAGTGGEQYGAGQPQKVSNASISRRKLNTVAELAAGEATTWHCAPAFWVQILQSTMPRDLPEDFAKSVLWAAAQESMLEEQESPTEANALTLSPELSKALTWGAALGYDDKNETDECVNAVPVGGHLTELLRLLKRCIGIFLDRVQSEMLVKKWMWEPWLSEAFFLRLLDARSGARDAAREALAHFSGGDWNMSTLITQLISGIGAGGALARGVRRIASLLASVPLPKSKNRLQMLLFYVRRYFDPVTSVTLPDGAPAAPGGFVKEQFSANQRLTLGNRNQSEKREGEDERQSVCRQLAKAMWPFMVEFLKAGRTFGAVQAYQKIYEQIFGILTIARRYLSPSVRAELAHQYYGATWQGHGDWLEDLLKWSEIGNWAAKKQWANSVVSICSEMQATGEPFSEEALKLVQNLIDSGTILSDQERLKLTETLSALPAPGNMRRGSLEDLPSRSISGKLEPAHMQATKGIQLVDLSDAEERGREHEWTDENASFLKTRLGIRPFKAENEGEKKREGARGKEERGMQEEQAGGRDIEGRRGTDIDEKWETDEDEDDDDEIDEEVVPDSQNDKSNNDVIEVFSSVSIKEKTSSKSQSGLVGTGIVRTATKSSKKVVTLGELLKRSELAARRVGRERAGEEGERERGGGGAVHKAVGGGLGGMGWSKRGARSSNLPTRAKKVGGAISKLAELRAEHKVEVGQKKEAQIEVKRQVLERVQQGKSGKGEGREREEGEEGNGERGWNEGEEKSSARGTGIRDEGDVLGITTSEKEIVGSRGSLVKGDFGLGGKGKLQGNAVPFGLVSDDSAFDSALDGAQWRPPPSLKPVGMGDGKPRRQVITLSLPTETMKGGGVGGGGGNLTGRGKGRAPPPKLNDWYKRVLQIDYFKVVGVTQKTALEVDPKADELKRVPVTFESAEKYILTFRPLLLEEFKAQLQRSHDEMKGGGSANPMAQGILRLMSVEKVDEFSMGRFIAEAGADAAARTWVEGDLLLLSKLSIEKAPGSVHCLAKVERRERELKTRGTLVQLKLFLPLSNPRLSAANSLLKDRSKWYASKLLSMVPQQREFQALAAARNFPLLPTLLDGKGTHGGPSSGQALKNLEVLPEQLRKQLQSDYNEPQLQAVGAAVGRREGGGGGHQLALIQGPPGTGKTRTILAIVSALLAVGQQKTSAYSEQPANLQNGRLVWDRRSTGQTQKNSRNKPMSKAEETALLTKSWQAALCAKEMVREEADMGRGGRESGVEGDHFSSGSWQRKGKSRVLVCAQSNAAVDELVARLSKHGVYGRDGEFYKPAIVRVGNRATVHPESLPVYIETLVEQRMSVEVKGKGGSGEGDGEIPAREKAAELRKELESKMELIQKIEALRSRQPREAEKVGEEGEEMGSSGGGGQEGGIQEGGLQEGSRDERENDPLSVQAADVVKMGESAVKARLNVLYRSKREIGAALANVEREERKTFEEGRAMRMALKRTIIREAEIVATTLSGCGGDVYNACFDMPLGGGQNKGTHGGYGSGSTTKGAEGRDEGWFDAVIIDEAAQALEPATLIPLQLLAETNARCIMVGDPKQLPATVLSQIAAGLSYERSMFERLQKAGLPVALLSTQYRMHPEIRHFPSKHFYDGQLTDGNNVTAATRNAPFHEEIGLGPYVVFDVVDGQERMGRGSTPSLCNDAEADMALELFRTLQTRYSEEVGPGRIGIITPYKQQLSLLRERFTRALGPSMAGEIEFNTVDGFQGREVDILIFSTVRAATGPVHGRGTIGFVADVRRMNVALTRARISLWLLGNAATLRGNGPWAALLNDAESRGVVVKAQRPYSNVFKGLKRVSTLPASTFMLERGGIQERCRVGNVDQVGNMSEGVLNTPRNRLLTISEVESSVSAGGSNMSISPTASPAASNGRKTFGKEEMSSIEEEAGAVDQNPNPPVQRVSSLKSRMGADEIASFDEGNAAMEIDSVSRESDHLEVRANSDNVRGERGSRGVNRREVSLEETLAPVEASLVATFEKMDIVKERRDEVERKEEEKKAEKGRKLEEERETEAKKEMASVRKMTFENSRDSSLTIKQDRIANISWDERGTKTVNVDKVVTGTGMTYLTRGSMNEGMEEREKEKGRKTHPVDATNQGGNKDGEGTKTVEERRVKERVERESGWRKPSSVSRSSSFKSEEHIHSGEARRGVERNLSVNNIGDIKVSKQKEGPVKEGNKLSLAEIIAAANAKKEALTADRKKVAENAEKERLDEEGRNRTLRKELENEEQRRRKKQQAMEIWRERQKKEVVERERAFRNGREDSNGRQIERESRPEALEGSGKEVPVGLSAREESGGKGKRSVEEGGASRKIKENEGRKRSRDTGDEERREDASKRRKEGDQQRENARKLDNISKQGTRGNREGRGGEGSRENDVSRTPREGIWGELDLKRCVSTRGEEMQESKKKSRKEERPGESGSKGQDNKAEGNGGGIVMVGSEKHNVQIKSEKEHQVNGRGGSDMTDVINELECGGSKVQGDVSYSERLRPGVSRGGELDRNIKGCVEMNKIEAGKLQDGKSPEVGSGSPGVGDRSESGRERQVRDMTSLQNGRGCETAGYNERSVDNRGRVLEKEIQQKVRREMERGDHRRTDSKERREREGEKADQIRGEKGTVLKEGQAEFREGQKERGVERGDRIRESEGREQKMREGKSGDHRRRDEGRERQRMDTEKRHHQSRDGGRERKERDGERGDRERRGGDEPNESEGRRGERDERRDRESDNGDHQRREEAREQKEREMNRGHQRREESRELIGRGGKRRDHLRQDEGREQEDRKETEKRDRQRRDGDSQRKESTDKNFTQEGSTPLDSHSHLRPKDEIGGKDCSVKADQSHQASREKLKDTSSTKDHFTKVPKPVENVGGHVPLGEVVRVRETAREVVREKTWEEKIAERRLQRQEAEAVLVASGGGGLLTQKKKVELFGQDKKEKAVGQI